MSALRVVLASLYLRTASALRLPQSVIDHAMGVLSRETLRHWFERCLRADREARRG